MLTLEKVLAAATSWPEVLVNLRDAVTSDLVVAGPYKRKVMEFVVDFYDEHQSLPKEGDYGVWLDTLEDPVKEGVKQVLGTLQGQDLSGYTPTYLGNEIAEDLRTIATRTALSRLNSMGEVDPATFAEMYERVAAISLEPDWEPPIPLGPETPGPFPMDVLPEWVGGQVRNVAAHTQTPEVLSVQLALAALSALSANKVILTIREGHTEPAILWTATAMPSGSRKSPAFRHLIDRHLMELEDEEARHTAARRGLNASRREVMERVLAQIEEEAAELHADTELEPEEREERLQELLADADELHREIRRIPPTSPPRLTASGDITSERLTQLLQENHGRMGILAPEAGDLFRILAGHYSGGSPMLGIWTRGWTGAERARDDRVGREGSYVRRPAITVGVTFQPAVLEELRERRTMRGEGLLARFIFGFPDVGVGRRKTGADVPGLDRVADQRWNENLRRLHKTEPAGRDEEGDWIPHRLQLSDGAREVFFAFEAEVEKMLGDGQRLEHIRDWGAKLHGQAARVALLLHGAFRIAEGKDPWDPNVPVSERAMEAAVAIARAAVPHALRAFNALELDPEVALGQYLIRRLRELTRENNGPLTKSELAEAVKGKKGLDTVPKLDRVLRLLEQHGWIRTKKRSSSGPGRPPSPLVELHPDAALEVRDIRRKADAASSPNFSHGNRADQDESPPETRDRKRGGIKPEALRRKMAKAKARHEGGTEL